MAEQRQGISEIEGFQMEQLRQRFSSEASQETFQEASGKERQESERKTPHREQGSNRCFPATMTVVVMLNLAYIVATALLIWKLIGWYYSIHCFVLCLFIILSFVQTLRSPSESQTYCWISCLTLSLVLMTTFTLLTRQVYYHPSSLVEPKWILLFLQASFVPLLVGILVMYECSIKELYKDRFILMITIVDFADIWDMASVLSQHKPPFLKEESPLEITVQFFCSLSFIIFSVVICTSQKRLKLVCPKIHGDAEFLSRMINMCSHLVQNIPFFVIRILIFLNHGYVDLDYLTKNLISVILSLFVCCQGETQD